MKYYIVDAFTHTPFGGNPAGVVLLGQDGAFPSEDLMVRIAAELRYSETAFVQQNGPAEFTVRYFTPRAEVDLCGHATIATFGTLAREGIVPEGTRCLNHTLAGDLQVIAGQQVMMQMATPTVIDTAVDIRRLHHIMACDSLDRWPTMPVEIVSTGLPDLIMPVADVDALNALRPDMDALSALSSQLAVTGVHAFALTDDGLTATSVPSTACPRRAPPAPPMPHSPTICTAAASSRRVTDADSCRARPCSVHRWWRHHSMPTAPSGWGGSAASSPAANCSISPQVTPDRIEKHDFSCPFVTLAVTLPSPFHKPS